MTHTVKTNSAEAWLLAARPKTLAGAAVPVIIGTAAAIGDGKFSPVPATLCLAFAFIMQIAANFINDLFDYLKGSDREDRLGPERACAQGWITPRSMKAGIAVAIVLACSLGLCLLRYGGLWLVGIGALCVLFAFLYTTSMSYLGLGDLLVFVFFGLVPVCCTYYVQAQTVTLPVVAAAAGSGIVIDTLLLVNNYRDREADRISGKKTLVVRLGERAGSMLYLLAGIAATALCLTFLAGGHTAAALLPLLYLPLHISTWHEMNKINHGRKLNSILAKTSRNMLVYALLILAGFML